MIFSSTERGCRVWNHQPGGPFLCLRLLLVPVWPPTLWMKELFVLLPGRVAACPGCTRRPLYDSQDPMCWHWIWSYHATCLQTSSCGDKWGLYLCMLFYNNLRMYNSCVNQRPYFRLLIKSLFKSWWQLDEMWTLYLKCAFHRCNTCVVLVQLFTNTLDMVFYLHVFSFSFLFQFHFI